MLNPENTGLIVVDVQGKLASLVSNSQAVISNCAALIQGSQHLDLPIIWLEQNPDKLGSTVKTLSDLLRSQSPITKYSFNACNEPNFTQALKEAGKTSWLICGIEAHICVYQTAFELSDQGFDVHLVRDCTSSRDPENITLAIDKLQNQNIAITSLEMCLYELVKDCRHPKFKTILNLIR
ncbi:hydrolase [Vibrio sonorensis]|uniref:hydrolase n=1 Tax=Vibrio sonorensis TaxID=1004316 RepID=UPI0008DA2E32|nr:hydrolase [Vibrio sonorensis]